MTLSYNLVLALFLLAPGFSAYAGLFFSTRGERRLHPAPPPPGSVLTLALIVLAALALHAGWSVVLILHDLWADRLPSLPVPFEPNAYVLILRLMDENVRLQPPEDRWATAVVLCHLVALSLIAYFMARLTVSSVSRSPDIRRLLYGWAAELYGRMQETDPGYVRLVTAFVLTNIEGEDGVHMGYEGVLENLALNAEKEVTSITLGQVTAFYLKAAPGRFRRVALPRPDGIPTLYLEKGSIRNIAFQVFRAPAPLG